MLKKLKSLFIIEDDSVKANEVKKSAPISIQKNDPSSNMIMDMDGGKGKVDKKFINILFKAMETNNIEGFDYLEFKQSLKSLQKMEMDEATRFQSAFAMAQTMGATGASLIQTADHYLKVLHKEEQKFAQALSKQQANQIGSKTKAIDNIDKKITQNEQKIAQLNEEIEKQKQKKKSLKVQLEQASSKVNSTKINFMASFEMLTNQIKEDIRSMNKFLK